MYALFLSIYAQMNGTQKSRIFSHFFRAWFCLFVYVHMCVWLDFNTRSTTTKWIHMIRTHTHTHNGVPRNCELISILHLINIRRALSTRSIYCKLLNTFPSHTFRWRNKIYILNGPITINSKKQHSIIVLDWMCCMHLIDGTWMAYKFATEIFSFNLLCASSFCFSFDVYLSHLKKKVTIIQLTVCVHNFIN